MRMLCASKSTMVQYAKEFYKDVARSKRLKEKWGKEFPTSYQVKIYKRLEKARRSNRQQDE